MDCCTLLINGGLPGLFVGSLLGGLLGSLLGDVGAIIGALGGAINGCLIGGAVAAILNGIECRRLRDPHPDPEREPLIPQPQPEPAPHPPNNRILHQDKVHAPQQPNLAALQKKRRMSDPYSDPDEERFFPQPQPEAEAHVQINQFLHQEDELCLDHHQPKQITDTEHAHQQPKHAALLKTGYSPQNTEYRMNQSDSTLDLHQDMECKTKPDPRLSELERQWPIPGACTKTGELTESNGNRCRINLQSDRLIVGESIFEDFMDLSVELSDDKTRIILNRGHHQRELTAHSSQEAMEWMRAIKGAILHNAGTRGVCYIRDHSIWETRERPLQRKRDVKYRTEKLLRHKIATLDKEDEQEPLHADSIRKTEKETKLILDIRTKDIDTLEKVEDGVKNLKGPIQRDPGTLGRKEKNITREFDVLAADIQSVRRTRLPLEKIKEDNVPHETVVEEEMMAVYNESEDTTKHVEALRLDYLKKIEYEGRKKEGQIDVAIFQDRNSEERTQPAQLALELRNNCYLVENVESEPEAGQNRQVTFQRKASKATFIVYFIWHVEEVNEWSDVYQVLHIKEKQGEQGHIFLVLEKKADLPEGLNLSFPVFLTDSDWRGKIEKQLQKTPNVTELYRRLYLKIHSSWAPKTIQGIKPEADIRMTQYTLPPFDAFARNEEGIRTKVYTTDDVLTHIDKTLKIVKRIIIQGIAGIGKSALLLKIADDCICDTFPKKLEFDEELETMAPRFVVYIPLYVVKRFLTHKLEVILCQYLELFPSNSEAELRSCLMNNGKRFLFILDGYDQVPVNELENENVISKLLKDDIAPGCSIIISTRPEFVNKVQQLCSKRSSEIVLQKLSQSDWQRHLKKVLHKIQDHHDSNIGSMDHILANYIPQELMGIPLLLQLVSYIWLCENETTEESFQFTKIHKATDIFNRICGILLGVRAPDGVCSLTDGSIPMETRAIIGRLAEMSIEATTHDCTLFDANCLMKFCINRYNVSHLGLFNVMDGNDNSLQGHFLHKSFQDFIAAYNLAEGTNTTYRNSLLMDLDNPKHTLSEAVAHLEFPLKFAVGMDKSLLEEISSKNFGKSTVSGYLELHELIDILHECDDISMKLKFIDTLERRENVDTHYQQEKQVNLDAYISLMETLAAPDQAKRQSELLKLCTRTPVIKREDQFVLLGDDQSVLTVAELYVLLCLWYEKAICSASVVKIQNIPMMPKREIKEQCVEVPRDVKEIHVSNIQWKVSMLFDILKMATFKGVTKLVLGRCDISCEDGDEDRLQQDDAQPLELEIHENISYPALRAIVNSFSALESVTFAGCELPEPSTLANDAHDLDFSASSQAFRKTIKILRLIHVRHVRHNLRSLTFFTVKQLEVTWSSEKDSVDQTTLSQFFPGAEIREKYHIYSR